MWPNYQGAVHKRHCTSENHICGPHISPAENGFHFMHIHHVLTVFHLVEMPVAARMFCLHSSVGVKIHKPWLPVIWESHNMAWIMKHIFFHDWFAEYILPEKNIVRRRILISGLF
jgi:hypothetical protein